MRFKLLLTLVALLLAVPPMVGAQTDTWYYALTDEGTTLVTYTLQGESVELLTDLPEPPTLWRIGQNRTIAQVETATGAFALYRLSSSGAVLIGELTEMYYVVNASGRYVIMIPVQRYLEPGPALLVDTETATMETLSVMGDFNSGMCCRISPFETHLRYITQIPLDENNPRAARYELRERDLSTGEERVIYSAESNETRRIYFDNDWYGEGWIAITTEHNGDTVQRFEAITLDGVVETIYEQSVEEGESPTEWREVQLFKDDLVFSPIECEADCTLEVYPAGADTPLVYPVTTDLGPVVSYFRGDGNVVLQTPDAFWLLRPDAPPEIIGYANAQHYAPFPPYSQDRRYLILANSEDAPTSFRIYDAGTAQVIAEISGEDGEPFIFATGIITHDFILFADYSSSNTAYTLYDTAAGEMHTFSAQPREQLTDFVSGTEVLVTRLGEETSSIYRLNITTGESELVLADAVARFAMPLMAVPFVD
jgi:hypothetical protein